jgi:hypothetical protein
MRLSVGQSGPLREVWEGMNRLLSPEQILEQLKIRDPEIIPPWVRDQWKAIAAAQDAQTMKWLQEQCQEKSPCEGCEGRTEDIDGQQNCDQLNCVPFNAWQGRQEGYAARQAELDSLSKEPKPCPCRIYDIQVCDKANEVDLANVCVDFARWYYRREGYALGMAKLWEMVDWLAPYKRLWLTKENDAELVFIHDALIYWLQAQGIERC